MSTAYQELMARVKETSLLRSTVGVLAWDRRTMMPAGGVEQRGEQLALLARLIHERTTDPRMGELLEACEADAALVSPADSDSAVNLRELRRQRDRAAKLPASLVEEMARTHTVAEREWEHAREHCDFARFEPWLQKNLELARRAAECYGWARDEEPWDALAEGYEPGMRASSVERVFAPLRERLQALLSDLRAGRPRSAPALHEYSVPAAAQLAFVREVTQAIGFDYERGRIDTTVHPFCSGTSRGDVRITTRLADDKFFEALLAGMHEAGHGMYEQGLPAAHTGTPVGRAVSLGVHESQSRLWENLVGRSLPFWQWAQPHVVRWLGASAARLSPEDLYAAVNRVEPGLIRVDADEATYNLHIMVRFELERALLAGELQAADVPYEWNQRYKEYLGVSVPDDAHGCLQDVHWSDGALGYFPTYTFGNLYAAQIFEKVVEEIPDLSARLARGEFAVLREWLNANVHVHGSRYRPAELCERATGKPLSAEPLLRHLEAKLRPLHGL